MLMLCYADSRPADMSIGKTFATDSWQIQTAQTAASLSLTASASVSVRRPTCVYREAGSGPLRKLSVGLIHTYKHINEVCLSTISLLLCCG